MFVVKDIDRLTSLTGKTTKELIDMGVIKSNTPNKEIETAFDECWKLYPRKEGKKQALRHFTASVNKYKDVGVVKDMVIKAISYYITPDLDVKYTKMGATFFNDWEGFYEMYMSCHTTSAVKKINDDVIL